MIAWQQTLRTGSPITDAQAVEAARAHAGKQGLHFRATPVSGGFLVEASQTPFDALANAPAGGLNPYSAPQAPIVTMQARGGGGGCESCGRHAPLMQVHLMQNIGMIVMRSQKILKGQLCKRCIREHGWKMTWTTFFLGWWGAISFIFTWVILPTNLFQLIKARGLKEEF
ncbi:MAG: hypothetical protein ACHREM_13100 [Polyangiales bacterium]